MLLATCHVTRLGDFGAGADMGGGHWRGDLRFCLTKANAEAGADTILFSRTGTINLRGALPQFASDIDLQGPGAGLLTVRRDTGGQYGIFSIAEGATVTISGVTIANGFESGQDALGGGIANAGTLTVIRSVIDGNGAAPTSFWSGSGGGIYNATTGDLTVIDSTISGNRVAVDEFGGFPGYGAGICNDGFASIYSSTISGNGPFHSSEAYLIGGAGISNWCNVVGPGGVLVVLNSTISENEGDSAVYSKGPLTIISHSTIGDNDSTRGIYIDPDSTLHMRNTIVAGSNCCDHGDIDGTIAASGYNVIGNSTGGGGFADTDILDVDPLLGPLQDNGGLTHTMALLPASPAIDAGENSDAPEWDQRGPGFPRIVNDQIDIGAFEVQATGIPMSGSYLALLLTADLEDE
jgi:hypothetical protein